MTPYRQHNYAISMSEAQFQWDSAKNIANQKKHGVSFEEASTVFRDEEGLLLFDPKHSSEEDRFILLGMSVNQRLLVVCHCYLENENSFRIFSARKATKAERGQYEERKK